MAETAGTSEKGLRGPSVVTWMRLARVYHKVDRAVAGHLSAWGLSVGQFDVLARVGAHEGITQNQLAESLLVTKSNICQIVGRMQRRGLILRRQDGRANRLFLTEEGRRLFDEVVPDHEAAVDRVISAAISAEEQRQLSKILRRLDRALG